MRIIAGKYRGLVLSEFKGKDIRPTADRVKESLFAILSTNIQDAKVLDLFCGSGNLGIESISRGANSVHFNDKSKDSITLLKKNLTKIKDSNYTITNLDYLACLSKTQNYDIIFIDPPYATDYGIKALEIIGKNNILTTQGIVIFEWDKVCQVEITGLKKYDERKYGNTYITFFKRGEQTI